MEFTYTLDTIEQAAQMVLEHTSSKTVLFDAPMGAGKTTLIKSICKKLGVTDEITSPTFSLVNEYIAPNTEVFHFDLYRIENIDQLFNIGIEHYLEKDAFHLVEWPEHLPHFTSTYQTVKIYIIDKKTRKIVL